MTATWSPADLSTVLPEVILTAAALGAFLADLFVPPGKKAWVGWLALAGLGVAGVATTALWAAPRAAFGEMVIKDQFSVFISLVILTGTGLTVLISLRYLPEEGVHLGEYYAFLLTAALGMTIMASGNHLMVIYVGLELMSLSLYVLAGFLKRDPLSAEAAMKYFLLSIFSSGILLYGTALTYGLTGALGLEGLREGLLLARPLPAVLIAVILLGAGLAFKVSAVPFHMWVPDVYEGSPTAVAAYMSVATKAAAFAVLARLLTVSMMGLQPYWTGMLWILAVLTMTVGNVTAVLQTSVKRMLAYSSIAQAGYILIGLVAANEAGRAAVLVYLVVYTFMNMGAFSLVIVLCRAGHRGDRIQDFAGLARTRPAAAAALVIFFLSLVGIPPTAGFIGKFMVFSSAVQAQEIGLAVIGVLNSVVSLSYYFRVVIAMYTEPPPDDAPPSPAPMPRPLAAALAIMCLATLVLGLYPGPVIMWAQAGAAAFGASGPATSIVAGP